MRGYTHATEPGASKAKGLPPTTTVKAEAGARGGVECKAATAAMRSTQSARGGQSSPDVCQRRRCLRPACGLYRRSGSTALTTAQTASASPESRPSSRTALAALSAATRGYPRIRRLAGNRSSDPEHHLRHRGSVMAAPVMCASQPSTRGARRQPWRTLHLKMKGAPVRDQPATRMRDSTSTRVLPAAPVSSFRQQRHRPCSEFLLHG